MTRTTPVSTVPRFTVTAYNARSAALLYYIAPNGEVITPDNKGSPT